MIGEQTLLRIYLRSTDQYRFTPVYERIVQQASHNKMAGATVLRGIMGFGGRGLVEPSLWHLAQVTPVIVEIVDKPERIVAFVTDTLGKLVPHGRITMERAGVMMYRHRAMEAAAPMQLPEPIAALSTVPELPLGDAMKINEDGVLLRVFIGEADEYENQPLWRAIVLLARELGLAGATVLKGGMGFGANSVLHTEKILVLSTDEPIVIEIVDTAEKINTLLPRLDAMVIEGLVTTETVRIVMYRHNPAGAK